MSESTLQFLKDWHQIMILLAPISLALSLVIFLFYKLKLTLTKSYKAKYDLVSKHETTFLFITHLLIGVAIFLFCNTYKAEGLTHSFLWFWIRLFISMCLGVLYAYVAVLMLKFYHPTKQGKRLKNYRYQPRINPKTGNEMKLLSEEEEDAYLDEGMQAEEDVFSVDYDVWIEVETGDTLIEKYEGRLHAIECDRCGFLTLKLEKEEVIKEITDYEDGELIKHYKCSYCKRVKRKTVNLSHNKSEQDFVVTDATKFVLDPLQEGPRVVAIKLEIHSNEGQSRNYEFQNMDEAQKFLKEFDYDKLKKDDDEQEGELD